MTYEKLSLPDGATASLCFDVLKKIGSNPIAIGSPLNAIAPTEPFIGRAFTVRGMANNRLTADESLGEWTRMLSNTPANSVLVLATGDCDRAYMGELSANALQQRHCQAAVVDGPGRDIDQMRRLNFPVYCRGSTPEDIVAAWAAVDYGQPVMINGTRVTSDDIIIGDSDGLCVTHQDYLVALFAGLNDALHSENKVRAAILAGHDPHQAYLKYRKF